MSRRIVRDPLPKNRRRGIPNRLTVEETSPHHYVVHDRLGNSWEVVVGADEVIEIVEEPLHIKRRINRWVKGAVKEHLAFNQ